MPDDTNDIESQLDQLLSEAESEATAKDAPEDVPAESPPQPPSTDGMDEDLDRMLDEAKAALSDQLDIADSPAPTRPAAPSGDETDLIDEIDAMLASTAEEALDGNFETIEELDEAMSSTDDTLPPSAGLEDDGDADADDMSGEMQSFEDMMADEDLDDEIDDPVAAQQPAVPLEAEASFEDKSSEQEAADDDLGDGDFASADDVAAELDAIEGDFAPADDVAAPEPAPAPEPEPAPALSEETVIAEEDKPKSGSPAWLGILEKINRPVMKLSELNQSMVGCIAIGTLLLALACFIKAILGSTMLMVLLVPLMSLQVAAIYVLILKPGKTADSAES